MRARYLVHKSIGATFSRVICIALRSRRSNDWLPSYRAIGWLPAVLPAYARRFRVESGTIATTLAEAGAALVDDDPDVEIAPAASLQADAPSVVVPLAQLLPEGGSRAGRAARRVTAFLLVRANASAVRARVRQLGYRRAQIIAWEGQSILRLDGVRGLGRRLTMIERLPIGALVVAHRLPPQPTVLDAVFDASGVRAGVVTAGRSPTVRAGVLVTFAEDTVLRTAIGAGAADIDAQCAALAALGAADLQPVITDRIPWIVSEGQTGLARWSLERRIPGVHVDVKMTTQLLDDCVEFLAHLFTATSKGPGTVSLRERAEQVAAAASPEGARVARELAQRIAADLQDVPVGFGHGDFWAGNLFARSGRLVGVVDWEGAGTGRLPLVDLLHLQISSAALRSRRAHGRILIENLEQVGRDRLVRAYCERLDLDLEPEQLRMLVAAYWLDYTGGQLLRSIDPDARPEWVRENVHVALERFRPLLQNGFKQSRRPRATALAPSAKGDALVLCYHGLSPSWPSSLAVTPKNFREQIELVLQRGYRAATFAETVPVPPFEKTVAITFDDSYRSVFEYALPILAEYDLPATVFVPTGHVGADGPMIWSGIEDWLGGPYASELLPMSWDELRVLSDAGWEIGSHTVTHPYLTRLEEPLLLEELHESRSQCEVNLGRECRSLAYPYGDFDDRVLAAARAAGYHAAATLPLRFEGKNPLAWSRVGIYGSDGRLTYRLKISAGVRRLRERAPRSPVTASSRQRGQ
jgi:peptidoglycan/xylan/chitin deacetylase (PgdA/CDA1 family)/aminoglycoside phosphotransferase (APT) family kinase protein